MNRRRLMGALAALALSLVATVAAAEPAPGAVGGQPLTAPLTPLAGTMPALAGKVVLLDVWATWCDPCRKSLPIYDQWQRAYGAQGLQVVAISVDEDGEKARQFVEAAGFRLATAWDPKGEWPTRLGLKAMPTAWLLDRGGKVVRVQAGFHEGDEAALEVAIKAALAAPKPAAPPP